MKAHSEGKSTQRT